MTTEYDETQYNEPETLDDVHEVAYLNRQKGGPLMSDATVETAGVPTEATFRHADLIDGEERKALVEAPQSPNTVEQPEQPGTVDDTIDTAGFVQLEEPGWEEEADDREYSDYTVAELKAELDERGIEYDSSDLKADLVAKL